MAPTRRPLSDGRWFFQHGPIDLVIGADGDRSAVEASLDDCWCRFAEVLPTLVGELTTLRRPLTAAGAEVAGPVAARMVAACLPHHARYITPMAAVAGAVADHLITSFERTGIRRVFLNNGGDIALRLAAGEIYSVGLFADLGRLLDPLGGVFAVRADDPVRGIATSGWRGRSFSLGIADSVTVLATDAANADAAATMIANEVDVQDPLIQRQPACDVKDDTDLGDLPVTVDVPVLARGQVARALARGRREAERLLAASRVHAAVLMCQGQAAVIGPAVR